MFATINGKNELVFTLEIIAKEMQKQSNRQWIFSICISVVTLLVAIAAIIIAIQV